jgi:alpha-mannosidase
LPENYSFVDCKTAGVIVETVKRAEDGDGVILRMYEAYKERKKVQIALSFAKEVWMCDLNERREQKLSLNEGMVEFNIKPFEIITLKIKTV